MTNAGQGNTTVWVPSVADEMAAFDRAPRELQDAIRSAKIEFSAYEALDLMENKFWTLQRVVMVIRNGR